MHKALMWRARRRVSSPDFGGVGSLSGSFAAPGRPEPSPAPPALPLVLCPTNCSKLSSDSIDLCPYPIVVRFGLGDPLPHCLQLASCPCFGVKQVFPLMYGLRFQTIGAVPFG